MHSGFFPHMCGSKEEYLIHFYYVAKLALPYGLKPCPRGNKFHNLGRVVRGHHSRGHHSHALSFIQIYIVVEKKIRCGSRKEDF